MMDWTDRHCRYFLRLISRHALLYTEMLATAAILCGDRQRLLEFHPAERPLAIQLGGSEPADLARCAEIAEAWGYDEVNLNVGCPSERVRDGRFGACLMAEPELVADCVQAMVEAVSIPVTVKTRIGVDEQDSYEDLVRFVAKVSEAGCRVWIIHARKAWLRGLSPRENRTIPPLRYEIVRRLKEDFPKLEVILNGGITSLEQAGEHLVWCDGVMLGRAVRHNPYLLAEVDRRFYSDAATVPTRAQIIERFTPYVHEELRKGTRLHAMTRHLLGLFRGVPGGRNWRRRLSEGASRTGATAESLWDAVCSEAVLPREVEYGSLGPASLSVRILHA
jgi:tRNA-dihydrouridine synthase A